MGKSNTSTGTGRLAYTQQWGSDVIADLLDAYDFEYITFNPGASFRGLEESIVNYMDNSPMVIETPNEGLSVSIAHGYAKATGRPAACILHNVVGTLNGAMGIYNAFIDRVPILILSGTGPVRKSHRRPWIDWIHTANVQGNLVREFVKWDDQPAHIDGAIESITRGVEIASTPPKGPVYVTIDHELQEGELDESIPIPDPERYGPPLPMAPDQEGLEKTARLLAEAEMPVIITDQVGDSHQAVESLITLAERIAAPVIDPRRRRFNFPNTHPLYLSESEIYKEADVILAIDVWELDMGTTDLPTRMTDHLDEDTTIIKIGTHELGASGLVSTTYRKHAVDVPLLASSERAVPLLNKAVANYLADDTTQKRIDERFRVLSKLHREIREGWKREAEEAWDETPISTARLAGEIWNVIDNERWVFVNDMYPRWVDRLWDIKEFDQYTGASSGGGGVGYGIGASIGAALAYADSDRVPVNVQTDGDLMQYLGALWMLGHYDIQLFTVMHNNRSMYNSTKHRIRLAEHRERNASFDRALIGTGYTDPTPDYATIAESMGVSGYGPIEDLDELAPTLQSAWKEAKSGSPVLVDVICQPK